MAQQRFGPLYNRLVSMVYEDDMSAQMLYLSIVEEQRKIPVDYLVQRGCLFIPNNDYIKHYLGKDANSYGVEFYFGERCNWTLFVLIPVVDLTGEPAGIVGWDAQNKFLEISEGQKGLPMYKISSKNVFCKEQFFLTDVELLKTTFDKRVIFITDGVFDSIALNYRDIPAIALLGSTFSPEILYFLRWYSRIYVVADNDEAGVRLFKKLRKALPKVYRVSQNRTKDIEELLRSDGKDGPITQQFLSVLNSNITGDIFLET